MKKRFYLSEEQTKKIEAAVAKAESRSSGEIVPVIAPESSDYLWVPLSWALLMSSFSVCLGLIWSARMMAWLTIYETALLEMAGVVVGLALGSIPAVKRWTVPRKWQAMRVKRAAFARFMLSGCMETRDRTGILIYLSLLEHRVEIVADKGIHQKVGEAFWQKEADTIAKGVAAGKAGEALEQAISDMAVALAEHFPRRADDTNELSDKVQIDD